jgi:hypothetical protein
MHIHVRSGDGEAKFWIEPTVSLADYAGLTPRELRSLQKIVEERKHEIERSWKTHFQS